MLKPDTKFKFTEDYQWDLLRYTVQDRNGDRALIKYQDDYFTLIQHQVLAYGLKQYFKKEKRVPSETMLRESVVRLLNSKQYASLVTKDEQKEIIDLISPLYNKPVKEGDKIYELCKEFASYVKLKGVLENIDINDYTKYTQFAKQINNAIADEDEQENIKSAFLLEDIKDRQFRRQEHKTIFPTPFRQINEMTNAGGYEKASILVLLDKQKKGKTTALANIARGYLRMRKKILVIDFENGRDNIFSRLEQSIMRLTKRELLSGDHDDKVQKRFRKYKRLGGEVVVLRLPALVTTADDIQREIDSIYRETGIQFDIMILDYLAKMGSISRADDERKRISEAYLDVGNLALKNDIEHIWTANHVTREGAKTRQKSRYQGEDIALCIDIVRHSHAIFGLNRTPEEEEAGYFRMEIVEQRDGWPSGRAVFKLNMETQRADELSMAARKVYDDEIFKEIFDDKEDEPKTVKKKRKNNDLE